MNFHVITLFPEICQTYTDASVLGRAQKTDKGKGSKVRGKKISVTYYNPRDFSKNKHKKVDDRPYGGGPGMVMSAEPVLLAWEKAVGKKTKALGDKKVIILQNHGILTTGPSVDIALWFYMSMERCCQAQLMAEAAGNPVIIPHETAVKTREFIANDIAAWASYQPAYDMIIKREPDLLD